MIKCLKNLIKEDYFHVAKEQWFFFCGLGEGLGITKLNCYLVY